MFVFFIFTLFLVGKSLCETECPNINVTEDRRIDKSKLRLVQYNVEWLFVDYYSPMNCPGTGCTWVNESEANTHMNYVSKIVNELKPDIINFCEVEGCDELNTLKNLLNDDSYIPYLKKGTDTSTGQNVGMLTRIDPIINLYRTETKEKYPISGSSCGYTEPPNETGVSKHYITEFNFNGYNIALISAHLIAIPTEPSRCSQREAQALVLQNIIFEYINRSYEVVMMGDFNDYDNEVLDINNNKPTSQVLDILKGDKGELVGLYKLYNVATEISKNERFSDWWDSDNNCNTSSQEDYSMIDHILVTDNIKNSIGNVFIYHGYDEFCGKYNSDHYPVVIDFIF